MDGLRAVAITLVLIDHGSNALSDSWKKNHWVHFALDHGHTGVMVFFVISGYLITWLLRQEHQRTRKISLSAFYLRRVLRIFPAFYTYLIMLMILAALGWVSIGKIDFLLAATYTWNYWPLVSVWHPQGFTYFFGHLWSLSLEEQFYLLWPPILVICGLTRSAWLALGLILIEPFFKLATYLLWPAFRPFSDPMLPWALDPLMFGALAALCRGHVRFETLIISMSNKWVLTLAAFFLLLLSPVLVIVAVKYEAHYLFALIPSLESMAILILLLWLITQPQTLFGRFFNLPLMIGVGYLSYSLYLWQQLFLVPESVGLWSVQKFPFNIAACLTCAVASYFLMEIPFLRLKGRISTTD